jgi:hypothetical protein
MPDVYALIGLCALLIGVYLGVVALIDVDNLRKSTFILGVSMAVMLLGGLVMGYYGALAVLP